MIKVTKKGIQIEGSAPDVLTNLTTIIKSVRIAFESEGVSTDEAKEDIQHCLNLAFMSDEELEKAAMEKFK